MKRWDRSRSLASLPLPLWHHVFLTADQYAALSAAFFHSKSINFSAIKFDQVGAHSSTAAVWFIFPNFCKRSGWLNHKRHPTTSAEVSKPGRDKEFYQLCASCVECWMELELWSRRVQQEQKDISKGAKLLYVFSITLHDGGFCFNLFAFWNIN